MDGKPYDVIVNTVKEEVITVPAKNEAEAIEKVQENILASSLSELELSSITKHYIVITTNKLKVNKRLIVINRWFVFFLKVW